MTKDTGGQAFPLPMVALARGDVIQSPSPGMSLRDYFAAEALGAIVPIVVTMDPSALHATLSGSGATTPAGFAAQQAYVYADAMLAERAKP